MKLKLISGLHMHTQREREGGKREEERKRMSNCGYVHPIVHLHTPHNCVHVRTRMCRVGGATKILESKDNYS